MAPEGPSLSEKEMAFRSKCAQHTCRLSIAQKLSAVALSLTRMPSLPPKSGASVFALPSVRILKTVTAEVAMVHNAHSTPAWYQVVPSVCFVAASSVFAQASSTGGFVASLTRSSTALTAPSEMSMPRMSDMSLTATRRLRWYTPVTSPMTASTRGPKGVAGIAAMLAHVLCLHFGQATRCLSHSMTCAFSTGKSTVW